MMRFVFLLAGLVLPAVAILAPAPAAALSPGDTVTNMLVLEGKHVPLPRGAWTVAGTSRRSVDTPAANGAYGVIETVVLADIVEGRVAALAEVNANLLPVADGWGRTASCNKGDQLLLVTRYRTGWDLSCFFIVPTRIVDAAGPDAWMRAKEFLAQRGAALPETALTVGFRTSDRQDVVDIRLHFDPAFLPGVPASEPGAWTVEGIKADPRRLRAVEMLGTWAAGADGWIEAGIANRIAPGDAVEGPVRAAILSDTPRIDRKLLELEKLYDRGAITLSALGAQENAALAERPFIVERSGGLPQSVKKNLSFRFFGSFVDYLLAYSVTLNPAVSAGITASIVAVHSVIFVFNDMYWDDYFAKQASHDANRVIDFIYIGGPKS